MKISNIFRILLIQFTLTSDSFFQKKKERKKCVYPMLPNFHQKTVF